VDYEGFIYQSGVVLFMGGDFTEFDYCYHEFDCIEVCEEEPYLLNISGMMHTVPTLAPRASAVRFPRKIGS
jgi:hypothetical protein